MRQMVNTRNGSGGDNPPDLDALVARAVTGVLEALRNTERGGAVMRAFMCGSGEFNKLKPFSFRSAATSEEAEDWITHMEKLFQVLGCPDNFKTRLAAFKLEGDALSWWTAHLRTQVGGESYAETCTWATFRQIFYNRYFPVAEQQRFEREYGSIYQLGTENSVEYMQRFMRLVSFVGPIAGDAERQARHYKWGLKRWVMEGIVNSDYPDVAQCCAAARNIELLHESGGSNKRDRDGNRIQSGPSGQQHRGSDHRGSDHRGSSGQGYEHRGRSDRQPEYRGQFNRGHDQGRQGQRGSDYRSSGRQGDRSGNTNQRQSFRGNQQNRYSGSGSSHQQHRSGNSSGQQKQAAILPPPPLCSSCGKAHPGPCYKATGACYECGSTAHKVKYCPKLTGIVPTGSSQPSTSTGRVHSLTREQAGNSSAFYAQPLSFSMRQYVPGDNSMVTADSVRILLMSIDSADRVLDKNVTDLTFSNQLHLHS
ncbi:zinc finger, CCHC-type, Retrotransposon gag domain protein [Artemisia annua]|uniref:Zinc finger, CCHC-type, Retrotransposon gag domain protein n=1 Tax=Artemisia annua TaxID=35608 RepID=A0A2U1PQ74_ARTAN|nr:zinc finger, CCHC-type, Retrotransposon gag domain protein [Artemisia annua]